MLQVPPTTMDPVPEANGPADPPAPVPTTAPVPPDPNATGREGATEPGEPTEPEESSRDESRAEQARLAAARRERERERLRHERQRREQEQAQATAPPPPPPDPTPPARDNGFLTLATTPWTQVSLNGRPLGTTPLIRVSLPPGNHTLRLVNRERGIDQTYRVTITAGETLTRRVGL